MALGAVETSRGQASSPVRGRRRLPVIRVYLSPIWRILDGMDSGDRWRLGHRPALDGLRGVAVLLVLVCHVGTPGLFAAGPVGVTLFFTLSGFLITSLLVEEHARSGQISLPQFYERRARRLAPALTASTAFFAAIGLAGGAAWFFEWSDLWPVLAYVGNWKTAAGGSLGALGGTWSLAVEEQFYIVWPLVVILTMRRGLRTVGLVAGGLAVVSLIVRAGFLLAGSAHAAYYRTDTSAVSLAAGAALAVAFHVRPIGAPGRGMVIVGAALTIAGCLIPGETAAFYFAPLAATVGALVLLTEAVTSGAAWMRSRWLRYLGSRSYGIYLWHIPLAWVLNYYTATPWPMIAAIVVPFSLLAAEASYRWIEGPIRAGGRTRRAVLAQAAA